MNLDAELNSSPIDGSPIDTRSIDGSPIDTRPIDPEHVKPFADLLKATMTADQDSQLMSEDEIIDDFADPLIDFARGSLACYDGDQMVGFSILARGSVGNPVHRLHQWGAVHPRYRGQGIGTGLLDWAEQAALRLHQEHFPDRPASLETRTLTKNTQAIELFTARCYRQARWFHEMMRDLSAELPARALPADIEVAGYTPERSGDARLVRNEAFRDHWGSTDVTEESWAFRTTIRAFRPALSFIAYSGGEPIGIVLAHEYDGYNDGTGPRDVYIPLVGTLRPARGRGIATALLTMTLRAARADGYDTATLNVDADSPTGAVGLYERLGFATTDTRVTLTKTLYAPSGANG